jgi:hypothetical protein
MNEASEVIQLATPFITYVLPAILIFSIVSAAEYFTNFTFEIINFAKKRVIFR